MYLGYLIRGKPILTNLTEAAAHSTILLDTYSYPIRGKANTYKKEA